MASILTCLLDSNLDGDKEYFIDFEKIRILPIIFDNKKLKLILEILRLDCIFSQFNDEHLEIREQLKERKSKIAPVEFDMLIVLNQISGKSVLNIKMVNIDIFSYFDYLGSTKF